MRPAVKRLIKHKVLRNEERGICMYYVYILQNPSGKYYVGYTNKPVTERIDEHNHGKNQWTRGKGPWQLLYSEEFLTKADAYRREQQIKRYKGGRAFKALVGKI